MHVKKNKQTNTFFLENYTFETEEKQPRVHMPFIQFRDISVQGWL